MFDPLTAPLFGSAAHKEAVAGLRWLISAIGNQLYQNVLTGEVGSGKTVAVRAAADSLDASRNTLIYLPSPQIGTRGIHGAVATALGQAPRFHHATLIPQVEAALAAEADERNRHVILAIDESHLLTGEQLEAVRMLTNKRRHGRADRTDKPERRRRPRCRSVLERTVRAAGRDDPRAHRRSPHHLANDRPTGSHTADPCLRPDGSPHGAHGQGRPRRHRRRTRRRDSSGRRRRVAIPSSWNYASSSAGSAPHCANWPRPSTRTGTPRTTGTKLVTRQVHSVPGVSPYNGYELHVTKAQTQVR